MIGASVRHILVPPKLKTLRSNPFLIVSYHLFTLFFQFAKKGMNIAKD